MENFGVYLLLILCTLRKYSAITFIDRIREEQMGKCDPPIKYLWERLSNGSLHLENLGKIILPTATEKDVNIYFYSISNPDPVEVNVTKASFLANITSFDATKESVFIIHGWMNDHNSKMNTLIKNAILEKYDVNMFVVDWSPFAQGLYSIAFANIPKIGHMVGDFLNTMSVIFNYPLSKIRIVAHSLGAHIAGISGKVTNGTLKSIVGLDPAGPLYTISNTENRLYKEDAEYVEVVHTCGKLLGFFPPMGDSDYYPNGGLSQPGCGISDITGACSHSRAYEYYAESVSTGGFIAKKCSSYYASYLQGQCKDNVEAEMGMYHIDQVDGKLYLKTNSSYPYAKGK